MFWIAFLIGLATGAAITIGLAIALMIVSALIEDALNTATHLSDIGRGD